MLVDKLGGSRELSRIETLKTEILKHIRTVLSKGLNGSLAKKCEESFSTKKTKEKLL